MDNIIEAIQELTKALKRQDNKNKDYDKVLELLAKELKNTIDRVEELEKFKKQFD